MAIAVVLCWHHHVLHPGAFLRGACKLKRKKWLLWLLQPWHYYLLHTGGSAGGPSKRPRKKAIVESDDEDVESDERGTTVRPMPAKLSLLRNGFVIDEQPTPVMLPCGQYDLTASNM
eukprot:scaffold222917_cov14-Tisochrysis_lutea.AAC.1